MSDYQDGFGDGYVAGWLRARESVIDWLASLQMFMTDPAWGAQTVPLKPYAPDHKDELLAALEKRHGDSSPRPL